MPDRSTISEIVKATKGRRLWFARALVLDFLAAVWRRCMWRTTFIAITGSFGKSTTNECLGNVLGAHWPVVKSKRNGNGFGQVSRVILSVRPRHRFAVVEVGTERKGMVAHWARIVRPDIAVVVNVGGAHVQSFPTLDDVAREKTQLVKGLKRGGLAVLNGDNPRVAAMADVARERGCDVALFGTSPSFEMSGEAAESRWPDRFSFRVRRGEQSVDCQTQFVGPQWLPSLLATFTAATRVGLSMEDVSAAIAKVPPMPARLQPVTLPNGAVILRDDTNSYLDAFKAAFAVLKEARCERRIFVTNGFTETPLNGRKRAVTLGEMVGEAADVVVFFGQFAKPGSRAAVRHGVQPENAHAFDTMQQVADFLRTELRSGDFALVKGRFGSHLARITFAQVGNVDCWIKDCAKPTLCDRCPDLGASQDVLDRFAPPTGFEQGRLSPAGS